MLDAATSSKAISLREQVKSFMDRHVIKNDHLLAAERDANASAGRPYAPLPTLDMLKDLARSEGLWNLFLPNEHGAGLTNLEYAPIAEVMSRRYWASEVFNCSAPDTGNMEVLANYGSAAQKERWLTPLLAGEIRSAFAMTEPDVASSDATNIATSIRPDGDDYVINGRKWYITGAMAERCRVLIVMGLSDPDEPNRHRRQSMILVPADAPGLTRVRDMELLGRLDPPAGHAELLFQDVRVPKENIILGEGRGFEIAQGRLGPGRIHHCMRAIGMAEESLRLMCERLNTRVAFHRALSEQGVWRERVADSRMLIDQARLMVLHAAHRMDLVGNKGAAKEIAMIKVIAPENCVKVIDWAIQAFGAAGFSQDNQLTNYFVYARHLRVADGPDEVHRNAIAKMELAASRLQA